MGHGFDEAGGFVHIVDDDGAVRRSLASLMSAAGLAYATYESGAQFLERYHDRGPACVVMDIRMPGVSGLQLLERMREAGVEHPAIIMTGYGEVESVIRAFRQGAIDFFEKPISGSLLVDHVQKAIEQDRFKRTHRQRVSQVRTRLDRLSAREHQVLAMLVEGLPNKQIAFRLGLSEKTVAAHRANLLAKLECESLAQAIARIVGCGIRLDPAPLEAVPVAAVPAAA